MRSTSALGPGVGEREAGVYAVMDLLGQRWMLRVIWELEPGPLGFLELRRRMGNCSSSMLADRLATLVLAEVVTKLPNKSYELTPIGEELGEALENVWKWVDARPAPLIQAARDADVGANARRRVDPV
ncbi:winged helix-turn-helix transcriptional regulator [Williamsia herbipolensis]|uniref:winged helix-turn-helix transcriptional regulator n=1 Tax=Williamsia herbipolensis TaxID=1603258 RepID=UPI0005F80D61|nr:helix-turn-helix domain-containing protein [Williamsia herbipolensis]